MRDYRLYIDDIIDSCNQIMEYIVGISFQQFESERMRIDAVIRNIGIIGEAANNIPDDIQEKHPEIPWHQMRGMRNLLIHEYWGLDMKILWKTVKQSIPDLKHMLDEMAHKTID